MNSRYFSEEEQVCRCCGRGADLVSPLLLERLDHLRMLYGAPIMVSCMYRCPQHNLEVGGEYNSHHTHTNRNGMCTAADIWVDGDYENFYAIVVNSGLFDGIGYYPEAEFVHVDVRSQGQEINEYWWQG